jgi:hypothetical protein
MKPKYEPPALLSDITGMTPEQVDALIARNKAAAAINRAADRMMRRLTEAERRQRDRLRGR